MADLEQLARNVGGWPRVEVQLSADFDDLNPSVGVALYRNAVRHARHATRVMVNVVDEGEQVRLTVCDDGDVGTTGHGSPGYGLVGMAERASLLGGTLQAGPQLRRRLDGRGSAAAMLRHDMTSRVLVADDQDIVRAGLTIILNAQTGIDVVGEAADNETGRIRN